MKKAFTLLELVFVIIVIAIITAIAIPDSRDTKLREAAVQLLSHIKYTQHLALVDDKYDASDANWYKNRWQLFFSRGADTNNLWSYTIFSDFLGGSTGSPDPAEVAINPQFQGKRLTGGANGATMIHFGDADATAELNIGTEYGILGINLPADCRIGTSQKIAFDHLGRPIRGSLSGATFNAPYPNTATNRLIINPCTISLCTVLNCVAPAPDEVEYITIQPETGFACISDIAGQCQ